MGDKQLWEGGKLSGVTCIADCAVANNLLSSDNPIVDRPNVMELVEFDGKVYTEEGTEVQKDRGDPAYTTN